MNSTELERFFDKVQPEPNSGCWLWDGATNSAGYGHFRCKGRVQSAYRVIFEHEKGPIPKDLEIDHLCNVRCCVNPDHLEVVTRLENCRRSWERGRRPGANPTSHCPKGHPYAGDNLAFNNRDQKYCLQCKREKDRAAYATKVGRTVRKCKRKPAAA